MLPITMLPYAMLPYRNATYTGKTLPILNFTKKILKGKKNLIAMLPITMLPYAMLPYRNATYTGKTLPILNFTKKNRLIFSQKVQFLNYLNCLITVKYRNTVTGSH
jgi:hypothetical protein